MRRDPGTGTHLRRRLLSALQDNCDRLNKEIAEQLDADASSVSRLRSRLSIEGYVKAYKAVLDPEKFGINTLAFVQVRLHDKSKLEQTANFILRWPEVQELHFIEGQFDFLLKLRTRTNKELFSYIREILVNKHNIDDTNTLIVMETRKETTDISFDNPLSTEKTF